MQHMLRLGGLALLAASFVTVAAQASAEEGLPAFIKPLAADAPKPPADPHDLRGMWLNYSRTPAQILTAEGRPPPFTPAAAAARAIKARAAASGKPLVNNAVMCRPPGFLWVLGLYFPVRIMQEQDALHFIFERFHTVWQIALDSSPSPGPASYLGHSTGRWQGNTLEVETSGFRGEQWLDDLGTLLSPAAQLKTRINKRAGGMELEVQTTIDDPQTYTSPWITRQVLHWRPDYLVLSEHDCEETGGTAEDAEKFGYTTVSP
jgi:hypothetical protein